MAMPARLVAVRVALPKLDGDQIELAVPDAALGDQGLGKTADFSRRPAQDGAFNAVFMIEMRVQGRHHQIVMAVLERHQAFGEFALARLRELGVDAVNLHHSEWTAGSAALYHRFGRYCLGWDAQQPRMIVSLLDMGLDGIFSDHVDRMVDGASSLA